MEERSRRVRDNHWTRVRVVADRRWRRVNMLKVSWSFSARYDGAVPCRQRWARTQTELDSFRDFQPVKVTEKWSYVFWPLCREYQPRSGIQHWLESMSVEHLALPQLAAPFIYNTGQNAPYVKSLSGQKPFLITAIFDKRFTGTRCNKLRHLWPSHHRWGRNWWAMSAHSYPTCTIAYSLLLVTPCRCHIVM